MNYANPNYIPMIFALTAAAAVFFVWAAKRRKTLVKRFVDDPLASSMAPSVSKRRRFLKALLILAAIFSALFSLAGPQWGFEWEEIKRTGLDILIAIDVSKSMLAADVKPNRLERTKFAVKDLVKKLNGDRIGLIAFAGTSFLQCPLTIDYNGFLLTLDDLNIATIPRGGTSMSSAIREAMEIYKGKDNKYKVMVIITDGEDLEGDPLKAARDAAAQGIRIYCVGVGTPEGELIPVSGDRGERGYLADNAGNAVKTKLNEEILKELAISTGGSYVRASQREFGLTLLYDRSISRLEKKDIETKMQKRYQDRFQYFLWIAVILLLTEPFVSERRRTV